MTLPAAVSVVECLALTDQELLRALLAEAIYKKLPLHRRKAGEHFDELIGAGLVVEVDDPAGVVLSPSLATVQRKLCTYLTRRNESENYVDEDGLQHKIPKGAEFVASFALGGPSLSLVFPDDEITELLDQYGVNRCKRWTP